MDEQQKKLVSEASAFAIMAAMEFGYKAHERGINVQQAWAELVDIVTGEKPGRKYGHQAQVLRP